MTTTLDEINRRFAALEAAHERFASTRTIDAGFASVRAAINHALHVRATYLRGPWTASKLSALEERALYAAPEVRAERAEPEVSPVVRCPRCLRADADRADVEAAGVCLDCHLAGHSTSYSPPSGAANAGHPLPAQESAASEGAEVVPIPLHVVQPEAGE